MSARSLIGMTLKDVYTVLKRAGYAITAFDKDSRFIKAESAFNSVNIEYGSANYVSMVL